MAKLLLNDAKIAGLLLAVPPLVPPDTKAATLDIHVANGQSSFPIHLRVYWRLLQGTYNAMTARQHCQMMTIWLLSDVLAAHRKSRGWALSRIPVRLTTTSGGAIVPLSHQTRFLGEIHGGGINAYNTRVWMSPVLPGDP